MPVGVNILACDITHTREKVVIVATLNIEGFWFSEIDSAIKRCGGSLFYLKLRDKISRRHINDGELFFLSRDPDNYLMGNFDSVIFNFDDLKRPLFQVILSSLEFAKENKVTRVAIPMIRTGWYLGLYEKTTKDTLNSIANAVNYFIWHNPDLNMIIDLVTYNNPDHQDYLDNFYFLNVAAQEKY